MSYLTDEHLDYIASEVVTRFPNAIRSYNRLTPEDNYDPVATKRYTNILMFGSIKDNDYIAHMVPVYTQISNPARVSVRAEEPFMFFIDPIVYKGDKVVLMQYKQGRDG